LTARGACFSSTPECFSSTPECEGVQIAYVTAASAASSDSWAGAYIQHGSEGLTIERM
jgi:hypothetical protein